MKLEITFCRKCSRTHAPGPCGKRGSAEKPSKKSEVAGSNPAVEDVADSQPGLPSTGSRALKSVGAKLGGIIQNVAQPDRVPTPSQDDINALLYQYQARDEHKRKLKREQMQRYRDKLKARGTSS